MVGQLLTAVVSHPTCATRSRTSCLARRRWRGNRVVGMARFRVSGDLFRFRPTQPFGATVSAQGFGRPIPHPPDTALSFVHHMRYTYVEHLVLFPHHTSARRIGWRGWAMTFE